MLSAFQRRYSFCCVQKYSNIILKVHQCQIITFTYYNTQLSSWKSVVENSVGITFRNYGKSKVQELQALNCINEGQ